MEETLLKALTAYTTTLGSTFTFVKLFYDWSVLCDFHQCDQIWEIFSALE